MCDAEHSSGGEGRAHDALEQGIGLRVAACGWLVHDHHLRSTEGGTGDGGQLPLPCAELGATLAHLCSQVQVQTHAGERLFQQCRLVGANGVQVPLEGSLEEEGILRHHSYSPAKRVQADLGDIDPVDRHQAASRLNEAQQQHRQRGLPGARPPHHSEPLARHHLKREAVHSRRHVRLVSQGGLVEFKGSLLRPERGGHVAGEVPRLLLGHEGVRLLLQETLQACQEDAAEG
mmetsp:Transcript_32200/g.68504  ORF Transcript_32200/g.68504 Transcript_32200/m.68504 type:complete len:232 (+) Transcript_32200:212-907(+)